MKLNLHEMVGKKYDDVETELEVVNETILHPLKVDFRLICELANENPEMDFGQIIGYLEMCEIPMTDVVRKLGICAGVLYA